jgi:hypothetical protein
MGLFKWHELVYSKFNDTQAVLITSGRVVDFSPDEEVEKL